MKPNWPFILVLALGVAATVVWRLQESGKPTAPVVAEAPKPPAPAASAPASGPEHPLDAASAPAPLAEGAIAQALTDLLGRKNVRTFFTVDDFPRRVVATVDNLGREHAPPSLWPVMPAPGRFTVAQRDGGTIMAADNSMRYTPWVLMAEGVDTVRAVDLYVRMYPLLQRAYGELGYPKAYFNDRVVAVIDQLLATPEVEYPVKLQLTEVKGPIPSERPWVRYEYADPQIEALSSGQKILLRTGPENQRRLKAKLAQVRKELVGRSPPGR